MARQSVTQTDLAPKVHLSLPALRRRLAGETPLLVSELFAIADALRVPTTALLPETDAGSDRSHGRSPLTQPPTAERNGS